MIGLELSVGSDASHRMELLQTLQNLSAEQLQARPTADCRVFEDLSKPNSFLWLQWWRSQQQLDDHLRSVPFRTLLASIKVLGAVESARVVELQDSTSIVAAFLSGRGETSNPPSQG